MIWNTGSLQAENSPPGSGWRRTHVACGAKLALERAGDFGETRSAKDEFLRLSPVMFRPAASAGLCIMGFWVSRPREMRDGARRIPRAWRACHLGYAAASRT